jgi:glycosyltransferase involved in cell wall biosynthesis
MTTLGVLITYCDERELLTECLQSLADQHIPPDEIVIYDDASESPATEYVTPIPDVRVIRGSTRRGVSAGRNILLSAARADYIHFHDSDDLFEPGWSDAVGATLRDRRPDLLITQASMWADGENIRPAYMRLDLLEHWGDLIRFCIWPGLSPAGSIFARDLLIRIGSFREELRRAEDFELSVRAALAAASWAVIDRPIIRIRARTRSLTADGIPLHGDVLAACRFLAPMLPQQYLPYLCELAALCGYNYFSAGSWEEGREALAFARTLGRPDFTLVEPITRSLIRVVGAERSARTMSAYRRWTPKRVRRIAHGVVDALKQ